MQYLFVPFFLHRFSTKLLVLVHVMFDVIQKYFPLVYETEVNCFDVHNN
jgi:hypothetical protein